MRKYLATGTLALALVLGVGAKSLAQQDYHSVEPGGRSTDAVGATKSSDPTAGEPEEQVVGPPSAGRIPHRGNIDEILPGSSNETMPAKFSAQNAARDAHWWLDRGQALTAEQKQIIYQRLVRSRPRTVGGGIPHPEPSVVVPYDTDLLDVPDDLAGEIPFVEGFRYLVTDGKVVLVDPVNRHVAAVIEE